MFEAYKAKRAGSGTYPFIVVAGFGKRTSSS
jgi:hypothetical protein